MSYRQWGRGPQQRSVLRTAPGLVIAAVAVGAAGGMTATDLIARWDSLGSIGISCNIKGNVSIDTGERIFHVPGQKYYAQTRIGPEYGERWFCSEEEAWAAGWRKAHR
ncbi:sunset domain-containing protein [Sinorhizobium psoraleae]|uniref:Succinoglycan biosynthesis protein exoi n=1 Tax=Sinorhizobium psoraleae TaxID=520838 RepID=A0ABT4K9Z8_9HYPH|nr:succinoglycan biosynthesis protein exoi [Sinorhizobium psoraleae]MCZ4088678.1 succinoglycan biosynthesis protein exoi [Sinorhizobium psoraleae]